MWLSSDNLALIVFLACITAYSLVLKMSMANPEFGKRGLLNEFYRKWACGLTEREDTLVAVQTMRNLIMSVTFLSSAMLILLGILIDVFRLGQLNDAVGMAGYLDIYQKPLVLTGLMIFSIFMFLLSLREMVRFTILIGLSPKKIEEAAAEACEQDPGEIPSTVFIKAMARYSYGIRGLYYLAISMLWFINTYAFIVGCIAITAFLIYNQRIPKHAKDKPPI